MKYTLSRHSGAVQVSKRQWNTGGPFDGRNAGCCGDAGEAPSEAGESGKIPRKGSLMRHEGGVAVRSCGVREEQLGCARQKEGP